MTSYCVLGALLVLLLPPIATPNHVEGLRRYQCEAGADMVRLRYVHLRWYVKYWLISSLERTHIDWNVPDNYEIVHRVGGGKYSEVSQAKPCADRTGMEGVHGLGFRVV